MKIPFLSFLTTRKNARTVSGNAYEAARVTETRPRVKSGPPADAADKLPEWTHKDLVENCRYAADNFGVAKEIITSMQTYAVGDGLRAQPRTKNPEWNAQALAVWRRFERAADVSGRFTARDLCLFAIRAWFTDGEIFFIKRTIGGAARVQIMETHRLSYKNEPATRTLDGISWNEYGTPQEYHFKQTDTATFSVSADYVIHFANTQRPSETRAAPALQHAIPHLKDAFLLLEMEKKCAAAQTNFAYALTTPTPETAEDDIDAFGAVHAQLPANASNPPPVISEVSKLDGGKMLKIREGVRLDILESKRPSQAFLGFHEALQRDATLGVSSYEISVDASKIGGATVRLQTAKMERRISAIQQELIDKLLRPLWKFVIGAAIARGELPAAEDWTEVEFSTPRRLTVDAGRESAALINEVKAGTRPIEDLFDAMGYGDWEEETRRRAQLIKRTQEIAAEYEVDAGNLAPLLFAETKGAGA